MREEKEAVVAARKAVERQRLYGHFKQTKCKPCLYWAPCDPNAKPKRPDAITCVRPDSEKPLSRMDSEKPLSRMADESKPDNDVKDNDVKDAQQDLKQDKAE